MSKLIILGAGASVDFGFPTGIELSKSIHSKWNDPSPEYISFFAESLSQQRKSIGHHEEDGVGTRIKKLSDRFYFSGAESIDDFLSQLSRPHEISFGKITLLKLILTKEKEVIQIRNEKNLFKWDDNWLRMLFGKEFKFATVEQLEDKLENNPVRFITFNYDRTLEYFILTAIKNYYGITQDRAVSLYKKIDFFHVYGKLAPLEWEEGRRIDFGADVRDTTALFQYSSNIKVINEDREDDLKKIEGKCYNWVRESDSVHILGFGFQKSNYKLLGIEEKGHPRNLESTATKFHYTTYGLSENSKLDIPGRLRSWGGDNVSKPYDLQICEYLRHHY